MIYARVEYFSNLAGEDDTPLRVKRFVGEPGMIALAVSNVLHSFDDDETLEISVESVLLQEDEQQ